MRDPRKTGLDPNTVLIAAAVGLALFLVAGLLFANAAPSGGALDPAQGARRLAGGRRQGSSAITRW